MAKHNKPIQTDAADICERPESMCITPEVAEALKALPEAKREILIQAITQETFSGPLPHPDIMRGYEDIQKGFAERILMLTEKQVDHRCKCEDKIVEGSVADSRRGQVYGLVISLVFGAASVALGLMGHDWLGGVLGGGTLVTVVTIFVSGRRKGSGR